MTAVAYRDAAPADGEALDAMAQASWIETFGPDLADHDLAGYLAEAHGPEGWLRRDLAAGVPFRLALAGDRIVGYAKIGPLKLAAPAPAPGAWELRQLYILRPWQGEGVAPALIDWAYGAARARGATELYLSVYEHNARARRFYGKQGFTQVGEIAFRVGTRIDRDLVLRRTL